METDTEMETETQIEIKLRDALNDLDMAGLAFICKQLFLSVKGSKKLLGFRITEFFTENELDNLYIENCIPFMDFKPFKQRAIDIFTNRFNRIKFETKTHNLSVLDLNQEVYNLECKKEFKDTRDICKAIFNCFVVGNENVRLYDILNIKDIGMFCVESYIVFPVDKNDKLVILNQHETLEWFETCKDYYDPWDNGRPNSIELEIKISEFSSQDAIPDSFETSISEVLDDDILEFECIVCFPFADVNIEPIRYYGGDELFDEGAEDTDYHLFRNIYSVSEDIIHPHEWFETRKRTNENKTESSSKKPRVGN